MIEINGVIFAPLCPKAVDEASAILAMIRVDRVNDEHLYSTGIGSWTMRAASICFGRTSAAVSTFVNADIQADAASLARTTKGRDAVRAIYHE